MSDQERNQERKQFDKWRERFIAEHGLMPTEADAWQARAALAQQAVPEPVTLADVLDALNVFNRPKPSEDDGPWEAEHFIRVDYLPAFINIIAAAWYSAAPAPQAEQQDERDLAINAETCAVCGEGKALLVRSCSCCGSLYAGSAEMRENQKQAGQAPAVGAGE